MPLVGPKQQDMADRKVLARADRNVEAARTFYESALADYDHAVVLDPQVSTAPFVGGGVVFLRRVISRAAGAWFMAPCQSCLCEIRGHVAI